MQTRANTKAVNHWFLMLFIVLIFLYFIGCVLALGTELERSELLSFFCCLPLITHILLTPVGELILCDTFMSTRRQKIA